MTTVLALDPDPRSVGDARRWVVDQLSTLGRPDLVDAARLAISELVTNAILHAEPPIEVRLGGTPDHPRVEVHDRSPQQPSLHDMSDDDRLLATIGRGLSIVATYSATWGAEMSATGKVVWFEPAPESVLEEDDDQALGQFLDLSDLLVDLPSGDDEVPDRLRIRLLAMPVRLFAQHRLWYDELRRELRLLTLSHDIDDPVVDRLSDLEQRTERERQRSLGVHTLDEAIRDGADRADLTYDVPPSTPATMTELREVLEQADAFCREHELLVTGSTPQLVALRTWYLGEFERQGRGEPPTPWAPGSAQWPAGGPDRSAT